MTVKMNGKLPGGDGNGLESIVGQLIENPHRMHVIIALVDCKKIETDQDTGETIPTARLRRVEVVSRDDIKNAQQLIRRAVESRSGATLLDIETEADLEEAFKHIEFPREASDSGGDEGKGRPPFSHGE